jgi:hypothetical protein
MPSLVWRIARWSGMTAELAEIFVSDANTVSLLTSYAFTPSVYLTVSPSGIPSVARAVKSPQDE